MSLFDSLKEEAKKRKQENQESADFIDQERERIRQKREEAREKRNIIRKKIKFVDDMASKSEAKKDAEELAKIEEAQTEKIRRARTERRNRAVGRNKGKIAIGAVVCLAVVFGGWFTTDQVQRHNELEKYNIAVDYILDENYEEAEEILQEVSTDDSDQLLAYAKVQQGIDSYSGEPEEFQAELDSVDAIENAEVRAQIKDAEKQVEEAEDIQDSIDKIVLAEITADSKSEVSVIADQVSELDNRYETLVDTKKLESAESTIDHIEKEDAVGKTILAINDIGEVTLESENEIETVRAAYNELKTTEKTEVVNSSILRSAEASLSNLKREKAEKEREEAERKAREKEEAERQAAEEQARNTTESSSDYIVYWVPNGDVYHSRSSCPSLSRSKTIYEGSISSCPKSRPCQRCY